MLLWNIYTETRSQTTALVVTDGRREEVVQLLKCGCGDQLDGKNNKRGGCCDSTREAATVPFPSTHLKKRKRNWISHWMSREEGMVDERPQTVHDAGWNSRTPSSSNTLVILDPKHFLYLCASLPLAFASIFYSYLAFLNINPLIFILMYPNRFYYQSIFLGLFLIL